MMTAESPLKDRTDRKTSSKPVSHRSSMPLEESIDRGWKFRGDEMTPRERMDALLNGKPVDHVPLFLFARGLCATTMGMSLTDFYADPRKSLEAQIWTSRMYGQDEPTKFGFSSSVAWDFGGEIRLPSEEFDQTPMVVHYPVETEEDIAKLKMPEFETAGILPLNIEFSRLQEATGLMITMSIGAPFMYAANVCGLERLARWMMKKPELAHQLLRMVTDYGIETATYWMKAFGAENIEFRTATPTSSNQVISPKQFQIFSLPYLKELHAKVLEMGAKYLYTHICGDQNMNLPYYAQVPFGDPGIASFGREVDLSDAIEHLGNQCIIVGNVEPALILKGTPEEVYEASRICIEKGKAAPRGFILGTGCEISPMSPPANVWAMRKAINDFGWY
jgi:uroporphyrinogen decarboxylase